MGETVSQVLSAWQSFYVIVGSSAAMLIGIQFVVVTLIANMRRRATADAISAFGTPTVVHLSIALLVSAIMSVPWQTLLPASTSLAMCGFGGLAYGVVATRLAHRQTYYDTEFEDWIWYAILPLSAYAVPMVTAILLQDNSSVTMIVI